ncbi:MAG: hypothetical protein CVU78_00350 [Elusimicrobia bacterium HGW-Elusimicrobia-2]|nr:MAG: hypothetical protein CVU78_00350 [Elusimicrobia bacterium HGW-Elusimicrobia-2]
MKKIILVLALMIAGELHLYAKKEDVTFEYKSPVKVEAVYVTGDFADWNATAHKMTYYEAEDIYRETLKFEEGKYLYKFVVNGSDWKSDPKNSEKTDDGQGGFNSVLLVGASYKVKFNEKTGDGKIRDEGLSFDMKDAVSFNPYAEKRIRFTLRTAAHDIERAELLIKGAEKPKYELTRFYSDGKFDYFVSYVTCAKDDISFVFCAYDSGAKKYFGKSGASADSLAAGEFESRNTFSDYLKTPEWAKHVVWYQIMVDRFRNGDNSNDPTFDVLPFSWDWFNPTPNEKNKGFYNAVWDRKFGGDLIGVKEELPYLQNLGITAVYFNPVFKSESYQKYNTADFRHIDDTFYQKGDLLAASGETDDPATWKFTATDKYFFKFIDDAHSKGIRVIVDGVFNHSGTEMFAFEDLRMKKKASKYADWYKVSSWEPFKHIGWAGFGSLPEFNQDEKGLVPPVKEFIFNITRRWEKPGVGLTGIDGWRLDVPMCVKKDFWEGWRKVVRESNPDAFSTGEIWTDASVWLNDGKTFDSVMNYEFAKLLVDYFIDKNTKISANEFDMKLRELAVRHPQQVVFVQYNLTNSHDTDRIASMIKNPDREYNTRNRLQNADGRNYDNSRPSEKDYNILKLIRAAQFAFPGAPAVYYGDEIGMWGSDDPNNRKPMWWDDIKYENKQYKPNKKLKEFMRRLIAVRNTYPVMRTGVFYPVSADDATDVVIYRRELGDETAYILINNSASRQSVELTADEELWDVLNVKGEIKAVTKDEYVQNGAAHPDGTGIYINGSHAVNCVSIDKKPTYKPSGGRVKVKLKPKTGLYLINKAYVF